jgi:hypothetical protein
MFHEKVETVLRDLETLALWFETPVGGNNAPVSVELKALKVLSLMPLLVMYLGAPQEHRDRVARFLREWINELKTGSVSISFSFMAKGAGCELVQVTGSPKEEGLELFKRWFYVSLMAGTLFSDFAHTGRKIECDSEHEVKSCGGCAAMLRPVLQGAAEALAPHAAFTTVNLSK